MAKGEGGHRWRFYRAGGVDQVRIETGADIANLRHLDQKLWVALSCPVRGLEFDERTLALLDTDGDGRVRAPEILGAIDWLSSALKSLDDLIGGRDGVALSNLNESTPVGKRLLGAARMVLGGLGRAAADGITVAEAVKAAEVLAKARWNGDGVVPPATVEDEAARRVAEDLVASVGSAPDRSGTPGYDAALLEAFFAECAAFEGWWAAGEKEKAAVWPLGDATSEAVAAYDAVSAKVDDYFQRCRLAAFDARAQAAVNRTEDAYLQVAAQDFSVTAQEIAHFPAALVEPGKPLPLGPGANPAWQAALEHLRRAAAAPILGKDVASLTPEGWAAIGARLAPHRAWLAARKGAKVSGLGIARVREILGGGAREALSDAIAADLAVAPEVEGLADLERLARYHRDLHALLLNFVSFTDFYAGRKAVFQSGRLYLDGRACDLCVRVNDAAKHGSLAGMAKTYLAYVDCSRPTGEKMTVAAAVTAGDADNLFVGRNGLFYDRRGRDWDATVAKLVDNPISVRQAFWAPYKKLLRWIEEQAAKRAAAADEAANARLQSAASAAGEAAKTGAAPAARPKFDVGMIAALGVAVGGITTALGLLLDTFFGMGFLMPLGILGLVLVISGPSMLIAWMKLRRRNLGPILDANGWAVNALTLVNLPLGRALTSVAALPPGSERSLSDPYARKKSVWPRILLVLLLLGLVGFGLWQAGYVNQWLPGLPDALKCPHPWIVK